MLNRLSLWVLALLAVAVSGCSVKHVPYVTRVKLPAQSPSPNASAGSVWALDSLSPREQAVLIDKRITPVSVVMSAAGTGSYFVRLSANKKVFRPFVAQISAGSGEVELNSKITWYIKPKGKNEQIAVGLYRVEQSATGKTEVITLLKQVTRRYEVVCNKQQWRIILFLKEHIFCSCRTPSPKDKL